MVHRFRANSAFVFWYVFVLNPTSVKLFSPEKQYQWHLACEIHTNASFIWNLSLISKLSKHPIKWLKKTITSTLPFLVSLVFLDLNRVSWKDGNLAEIFSWSRVAWWHVESLCDRIETLCFLFWTRTQATVGTLPLGPSFGHNYTGESDGQNVWTVGNNKH